MVLSIPRSQGETFRRWTWRRPLLYADEYVWLAAVHVVVLVVYVCNVCLIDQLPTNSLGLALNLLLRCLLPLAVVGLAEHVGRRGPQMGRRLATIGLAMLACVALADAGTLWLAWVA